MFKPLWLTRSIKAVSGVGIKNLWIDIFLSLFCFIECFILIVCVKIRPHSQCKAATTTELPSLIHASVNSILVLTFCDAKIWNRTRPRALMVDFRYLVFAHVPGESYRRRLRSLLYLCCTFLLWCSHFLPHLLSLTAVGSVSCPLDSGQKL